MRGLDGRRALQPDAELRLWHEVPPVHEGAVGRLAEEGLGVAVVGVVAGGVAVAFDLKE